LSTSIGSQSDERRKISPTVVSTVTEQLRKNASGGLDILKSELTEEERAVIMALYTTKLTSNHEFFIAINQEKLMRRAGRSFTKTYVDAYHKLGGKGTSEDLIQLAKIGLGERLFEKEVADLKMRLKDEPMSIERSMIRAAIPYARGNIPNEKELKGLTRDYLLHSGQIPTDDLVKKTVPLISAYCRRWTPINSKIATIDPNARLY
jgi:hypothetical protein